MSLRIGLIGCGEHSEIGHAIPLARYSREHRDAIALNAACDLRPERAALFCRNYGFARSYADLDHMLRSEQLDVCITVAPVNLIAAIGIRLLGMGIPCVVEKPLGSSIAEVEQLLEAARSTGTPNMVSVNRRFIPLLNRGIQWAKRAGGLHYLRATMLRHERTEPDFLRFTAIHALDTLRYIGGNFTSCDIQTLTSSRPFSYAIDVQFESGTSGRIDVLPTAGMLEETYELVGHGFRVVVTSPFGPRRLLRCYQQNTLVHEEIADRDTPEDVIFGFYDELIELLEGLSGKKRLQPSIEDIFPSVQACFELADRIERRTSSKGASLHVPS